MTDPKHLLTLRVYLSALLDEGHRIKSCDTVETFSHPGITFIFFFFFNISPKCTCVSEGTLPRGAQAPATGCCPHGVLLSSPPCCHPGAWWSLWAGFITSPANQMLQEKGDDFTACCCQTWREGGGRGSGERLDQPGHSTASPWDRSVLMKLFSVTWTIFQARFD